MEVESITSKPFTINQRASSLSEQNKSALTDHASHDNHVINWPAATILDRESDKKTSKKKQERDSANRRLVVLPYVEGTSERIARVMRKHQVPVVMKPVKTLKSLLVHPKDKQEKEEITDCVYKIPCASGEKCYIRQTGRKFGTRLKEHNLWLMHLS